MQGKTDWDILFEIMAVDFEAGIMIHIKTKIPKFILILKEKLKGISDNFHKFYKCSFNWNHFMCMTGYLQSNPSCNLEIIQMFARNNNGIIIKNNYPTDNYYHQYLHFELMPSTTYRQSHAV